MIQLVVWSFAIALTPVALGLARELIVRAADLMVRGLSRAPVRAEQRRLQRPLDINPRSGRIPIVDKPPSPVARQSWA